MLSETERDSLSDILFNIDLANSFAEGFVDGRLKKATAAGGKAMREPFDIPGVSRIAILMDSRSAAIGLITPAG